MMSMGKATKPPLTADEREGVVLGVPEAEEPLRED
jgi:hypothetical protein